MTGPQLILVSLALSIAIAALGLVGLGAAERRGGDPDLRERMWTWLLYLAAAPVGLVLLALLVPAPVVAVDARAITGPVAAGAAPAAAGAAAFDLEAAALMGVTLVAGLALVRTAGLLRRATLLARRVEEARDAAPDIVGRVRAVAVGLGAPMPRVRVSDAVATPLLSGVFRPVLLLPTGFSGPAADAICAHELAHLRRGDHRAVWVEETLLALLAANPLLGRVRDRRAAAREEACDALALAGAPDDARRAYARALVDALRTPCASAAPGLTFTSAKRSFAMLRLKAILAPATPAGPRLRRTAVAAAVIAAAAAASGSLAVAAQREPVMVPPQDAAPAADRTIRNPAWATPPTAQYPAPALAAGATSGSVTVTCMAHSDGRLTDCAAVTEAPAEHGFAAAALAAAGTARIAPSAVAGVADPVPVTFTVRFRIG